MKLKATAEDCRQAYGNWGEALDAAQLLKEQCHYAQLTNKQLCDSITESLELNFRGLDKDELYSMIDNLILELIYRGYASELKYILFR